MQEPGVIRTRLWTERGLPPFIRSTICPEANSNIKREMGIFADRAATRSKCQLSLTAAFLPPSQLP
jgi:hypothetical protein